ncbi:MAG TPA: MFS transporter, partial [Candidatus Binatia bacterium]|nr:MFS transporter [Candidatus Binatia bacterium]
AACALAGWRFTTVEPRGTGAFSARAAVASVVRHPFLRRLTIAHALWGGGLIASTPLVVLVQIDRLGLSVAEVGWIAMAGVIATMGSLFLWGSLADRRGGLLVIQVGGLLTVLAILLYAVAETPLAVAAGTVLVGLAVAAAEVAVPLLVVSRTASDEQAPATAGMNALLGLRGIFVPLVAIVPVQAGLTDVRATLVVCAVVSGLGMLVYVAIALAETPARPAWLPNPSWRARMGRVTPAAAGGAVLSSIGARFASLR